ncbi:hypothetical protein K435DRAFT_811957, partial [Dendrothele bispora CBS 962.96]
MAPSIDRPTYDIVTFLHRRFRHFFTPGGGPPTIIPRAEFADFVDEVSLSIQFLHSAVTSKTLPTIAIRVYHECVRTLLLSFSTNQVPVPDWCPGWLDLDRTSHIRTHWDPATDLPRSSDNPVAAPPAVQQQEPLQLNLLRTPQHKIRLLQNQTFGQPSTLLRNIAGTPINTVNPSTPSRILTLRTVLVCKNRSSPPKTSQHRLSRHFPPGLRRLQHETGVVPFLAPKQPTSTSTPQNPIGGRSSSMAAQDDELTLSVNQLQNVQYRTRFVRELLLLSGNNANPRRHVLESSPLIASQLNRLLSMQQNMETEAQAMMQRINHFDREVVVLRGMMRDVPR